MYILRKLPNAKNRNSNPPYGIARALIERDMNNPTKIVDYLSVQRELSNRYRQLQNLEGQKQERTEVALSAETSGGGRNSHPGRFQDGHIQKGGHGGRYQRFGPGHNNSSGGRTSGRGGRSQPFGRQDRGQRDMSKVNCFYCGQTGHVKADCQQWKKQQAGNGTSPNASAMAGTETYSLSLTAMPVLDPQQQFGEPISWSFNAFEEYEGHGDEVIIFENPYEPFGSMTLADQTQNNMEEAMMGPTARIPIDPPGTLARDPSGRRIYKIRAKFYRVLT